MPEHVPEHPALIIPGPASATLSGAKASTDRTPQTAYVLSVIDKTLAVDDAGGLAAFFERIAQTFEGDHGWKPSSVRELVAAVLDLCPDDVLDVVVAYAASQSRTIRQVWHAADRNDAVLSDGVARKLHDKALAR